MFLWKLWPWFEANRKQMLASLAVVLAVVFIYSYWSWQREHREEAAGLALSALTFSASPNTPASQMADNYLKVAGDHPGTLAGERAQLQGAATLFDAGRYADAQAQFQKYLDAHPTGAFVTTARLGVATSEEAQNQLDAGDGRYLKVIGGSSEPAPVTTAKFALGRISEQKGKLTEALNYYQDVACARRIRTAPSRRRPTCVRRKSKRRRRSKMQCCNAATKPALLTTPAVTTPVPAK